MGFQTFFCLGPGRSYRQLGADKSFAELLTGCDRAPYYGGIVIAGPKYRLRRNISARLVGV